MYKKSIIRLTFLILSVMSGINLHAIDINRDYEQRTDTIIDNYKIRFISHPVNDIITVGDYLYYDNEILLEIKGNGLDFSRNIKTQDFKDHITPDNLNRESGITVFWLIGADDNYLRFMLRICIPDTDECDDFEYDVQKRTGRIVIKKYIYYEEEE